MRAGLRLGQCDELLEVLRGQVRVHHQHRRHGRDHRHRHEALVGVVRKLGEHRRIDRERPDVTEDQRVAVGLRTLHGVHRDIAGAAGTAFDDDLLLPGFGELRSDQARQELGAAARRERHDEHNGLVRVVGLRRNRRNDAHRQRRAKHGAAHPSLTAHAILPCGRPRCSRNHARFRRIASVSSQSSPCRRDRPCARCPG